jgi:hypothetical protein
MTMACFFNSHHKLIVMKKFIQLIIAVLINTAIWAQDGGGKDVNVNVNTKNGAWYASPWVWVIGAAIFILLLVAISRGGSRRSD